MREVRTKPKDIGLRPIGEPLWGAWFWFSNAATRNHSDSDSYLVRLDVLLQERTAWAE